MGVLGSWFLVLGSWFLVLGSWFFVLGSSLEMALRGGGLDLIPRAGSSHFPGAELAGGLHADEAASTDGRVG